MPDRANSTLASAAFGSETRSVYMVDSRAARLELSAINCTQKHGREENQPRPAALTLVGGLWFTKIVAGRCDEEITHRLG